jgi:hypothetical protein
VLDWIGDQRHASAALPPGKTRYPLYWRLGGPVWAGAENLASAGIRSPARPAVASRYTNYAIPAHKEVTYNLKYFAKLLK